MAFLGVPEGLQGRHKCFLEKEMLRS